MAKPAAHFESCCGGLCGAEAFESCCEAFEGFKACPKRATRQFRSPIETACRANRKAHGGTMAKPAGRFESCCRGLCGAEAFESCCEAFEGFKACPKRATGQFRSPIETAFGANRAKPAARCESCCGGLERHMEAPWQSQQDASRAAAEGCAVLRLAKAAARLLKVLRPAQNVPRSSFEAQ